MNLLNSNVPNEVGEFAGETLKSCGMTPVIPVLNSSKPVKEREPDYDESYGVDDLLRDYAEWHSISTGDDEYCCEDDPWVRNWLLTPQEDIIYPWEVNEMQNPWEMEKSCYEFDLVEGEEE